MNFDFYSLPDELQKFFEAYHLMPSNTTSANRAVKMILENFSAKKFKVRLTKPLKRKDGTLINEVMVDENNLYSAFLPEVWQKLSVEQKIQLINMTFNNLVAQDKTLRINPPKLAFFEDYIQDCFGVYDNDSNTVTIKLNKMLTFKDGFDIPSYLVHELTHAKQNIERDKLIENGTSLQEMSEREVAIIFSATGKYMSAFKFFEENDLELLKQLVVGINGITEKDLEIYKKAIDEKDAVWTAIYKLPYLFHPKEVEAYRTQNYFRNKMIDSLSQQYEISEFKNADEIKLVIDALNNNKQFKIDEKTIEMLAKLNYALCSTVGEDCVFDNSVEALDITCSGLKTLIDLYNNKQIENIDYLDYDKLLILKQQSLENEKSKMN